MDKVFQVLTTNSLGWFSTHFFSLIFHQNSSLVGKRILMIGSWKVVSVLVVLSRTGSLTRLGKKPRKYSQSVVSTTAGKHRLFSSMSPEKVWFSTNRWDRDGYFSLIVRCRCIGAFLCKCVKVVDTLEIFELTQGGYRYTTSGLVILDSYTVINFYPRNPPLIQFHSDN